VINSNIQTLQSPPIAADRGLEKTQATFKRGFSTIEELLVEETKYFIGDEITVADVFVIPQVENAVKRFKINMDDYPRMKARVENVLALDAVKKAHPMVQVDTPDELPAFLK